MAESSILNLLIVDRSLSDIEQIAQALRSSGFIVQLLHSGEEGEIHDFIQYKAVDLILVRSSPGLPSVATVRAQVEETGKDIPIVAIVDAQMTTKPIALLQGGADSFFELEQTDHLLRVVKHELDYYRLRQQVDSFQRRYEETEARSRALLDSARDAIAYIHEGVHVYANPAYLKMFGYASLQDLESIPLINLVIAEHRDMLRGFLRRSIKTGQAIDPLPLSGLGSNGDTFPILIECTPVRIDGDPSLQIVIRATEREEQQKLVEYSNRDELTGLYNRKALSEYLHELFTRADKPRGALIYVLLSDYRSINERLGLIAIDQLLRDIAKLIQSLVSDKEVVAHFSDAVIVIYTPLTHERIVNELAVKISGAIKEHTSHAAKSLVNTGSAIGIYMFHDSDDNETQALFHADRACSLARQQGENRIQVYRPPTGKSEQAEQASKEILSALREAIAKGRLGLLYQPIASFQDGGQERYKIYLQLLDDKQKPLSLKELGPVAEANGLMQPLDRWTIVRVLETLVERYQNTKSIPIIFVRMSANSITHHKETIPWLKQRLADTGLPGGALVIEVKEETAEQYLNEVQALRENLRGLGCGFALSHFGGRQHSEHLVQQLKPDYVKVDNVLIEKMTKDENGRRALSALTQQISELNIPIIASSIANAPQMASIWQFGITLVQGDMVREPSSKLDFNFREYAS